MAVGPGVFKPLLNIYKADDQRDRAVDPVESCIRVSLVAVLQEHDMPCILYMALPVPIDIVLTFQVLHPLLPSQP